MKKIDSKKILIEAENLVREYAEKALTGEEKREAVVDKLVAGVDHADLIKNPVGERILLAVIRPVIVALVQAAYEKLKAGGQTL